MTQHFPTHRRAGWLMALATVFVLGFASTAAAQNADLGIVKGGPGVIEAGSNVTYTVSVSNVSDSENSTPNNVMTDTLPAGMTFVSADFDPLWDCTTPALGAAGTITCTYESAMVQEQTFVFTFVFHLDSGASNGSIILNTATIAHAGSDPNSGNDSSTAESTVGMPPPPPIGIGDVLISEFRLSGPAGNSDEFIELYCNRATNCDLSMTLLRAYDPNLPGDFSITFPQGTVIPARHYLLVGDSGGYSLSTYGFIDFDVHNESIPDFFIDNQGIQLLGAEEPLVIDSVGFIGGGNEGQYIEGTGLQPATSARPLDQYSYVRRRELATNGLPQDTNNNANDFVLISVTGTAHPGITGPPVLGGPGPQGFFSPPSYDNSQLIGVLVEPGVPAINSPNRVRTGSGNSGTLSIRRSFTNNTNETFGYIAFRVIEITTLNGSTNESVAELRLITSQDAETFTNSQARTVVIRGTILEYDVGCGCEPHQPNGGGLNSTVSVILPVGEEIGPGETVDVQFLLNVVKAGAFRFYIYVEAFPAESEIPTEPVLKSAPGRPRRTARSTTPVPRQFINLKRAAKPVAKKPKFGNGVPTKMGNGQQPVIDLPVRAWIITRSTPATRKRQKRKVRLRRKASAALRAKAELKNGGERQASDK